MGIDLIRSRALRGGNQGRSGLFPAILAEVGHQGATALACRFGRGEVAVVHPTGARRGRPVRGSP